jgi:hypothetical protein
MQEKDSQPIQLGSEGTTIQEKDSQPIQLGPGGLILHVPANEELLEKIRRKDPLLPPDLVNLADFFRVYMTNVPLGNHLELVALRQLISEPGIQKALRATSYADRVLLAYNYDPPEWLEIFGEDADPPDESQSAQVKWISLSGVGLLIEIAYYRTKNGKRRKHYHIIGVSPDPRSLQPDAQGRVVHARINKDVDPARDEQN